MTFERIRDLFWLVALVGLVWALLRTPRNKPVTARELTWSVAIVVLVVTLATNTILDRLQ